VTDRQGDRLKVSLPAKLTQSVLLAATLAGTSPTAWIVDLIERQLHLPRAAEPNAIGPVAEPVVAVQLHARRPGEAPAGWTPGMSSQEWWNAASRAWALGPQTRRDCRVLCAADPQGITQRIWRIAGWTSIAATNRWAALNGREIGDSEAPEDVFLRGSLLGRSLPAQRNPVRIIRPSST
jgi:hypothetical protein